MWNKGWRCEENCKTLFILLVLCTALLVWLEFCTQLLVLSRSNGLRSSMRQCLWRTSVKHEAMSLADFGQAWGSVFGGLRSRMRQCLWQTSVKHEAMSLADFGQARGKVFGRLRSSTRQGLWRTSVKHEARSLDRSGNGGVARVLPDGGATQEFAEITRKACIRVV